MVLDAHIIILICFQFYYNDSFDVNLNPTKLNHNYLSLCYMYLPSKPTYHANIRTPTKKK